MVHLVPMNWTNHQPGQERFRSRVYSNQKTVELLLNGRSLGSKSFDAKDVDGTAWEYLETTECSNDDKNYTTGTCPRKLPESQWQQRTPVPEVARTVPGPASWWRSARDGFGPAGRPGRAGHRRRTRDRHALTPDRNVIRADGKSLSYVTVKRRRRARA